VIQARDPSTGSSSGFGDGDGREEIMEHLLRTQMQARYAPDRLGHFGLALATYAHFTSPDPPLRDLLVHPSLVDDLQARRGGLPRGDEAEIRKRRRADLDARAARDGGRAREPSTAMSRPTSRPGRQLVSAGITGVQPFGFFARSRIMGGDGLVLAQRPRQRIFPLRRGGAQLIGDETGETYRRPAADAAAGRGQPGLGLAALRAARRQLRRSGAGPTRPPARDAGRAAGPPTSAISRTAAEQPSQLSGARYWPARRVGMAYKIAIIVGSLRKDSLNRKVARSICALRNDNLDCSMIEIGDSAALQPGPRRRPARAMDALPPADRGGRRRAVLQPGI
jgi:hypothetical protein